MAKKVRASEKIEPGWLKLKEASRYSGLGTKRLVLLAKNEKIFGYKHGKRGDWIFSRKSIDSYHFRQKGQDPVRNAVANVVARWG